MFLYYNTYVLAIRVLYGFVIRIHGMCEVTPYMEATTACCGMSLNFKTKKRCIFFSRAPHTFSGGKWHK